MTRPPETYESLGPLQEAVEARLAALDSAQFPRRLFDRDPSLWKGDPASIRDRLGWLDLPEKMKDEPFDLRRFADDLKKEGFRKALLLGMGGSSLGAEVLAATTGTVKNSPELRVLDSTLPSEIRAAESWIEPGRTIILVSSKSGTTLEVVSLYRHFRSTIPADRFVVITDPGAPLTAGDDLRRRFLNPRDVGGRFSVLSRFGLVPAALCGVNLDAILDSARDMREACGPEVPAARHPGLRLGAILAEGARAGRDKMTLLLPPSLASLGGWIEQLVAESTGKEGRGILPVDGEPLGAPESYGSDRLFVYLRADAALDDPVNALEKAGHPIVRIPLRNLRALGAEFFRWEVATAVAGAILDVNPFDEPNVKESKDRTAELLDMFAKTGKLPDPPPAAEERGLRIQTDPALAHAGSLPELLRAHLARLRTGDALHVLAFLPKSPSVPAALQSIRTAVRNRYRAASTLGFGPRYLHSTGQLHKGGPDRAVFLLITSDDSDLPIPGAAYGFQTLAQAQALGDFQALARRGRRIVRLHLTDRDAFPHLTELLTAAV